MISLSSPVRYSAEATEMLSGSGFTVTVVISGAETMPPVFFAVVLRVIVVGVIWVKGRVGAVRWMVAPVPGGLGP